MKFYGSNECSFLCHRQYIDLAAMGSGRKIQIKEKKDREQEDSNNSTEI